MTTLRDVLQPLLELDGLLAVLVATRDGLPVEMIGHGLRADHLAAEIAGVAEAARRGFVGLGMGEPAHASIRLPDYEVLVFRAGDHHLALVREPAPEAEVVAHVGDRVVPDLVRVLGGAA